MDMLLLTQTENSTINRQKNRRKCQRFAKLKELQSDTRANAFAAHLILPNRNQAHPPPNKWTVDNLEATFNRNGVKKLNFDNWKIEVINDDKNRNKTVSI